MASRFYSVANNFLTGPTMPRKPSSEPSPKKTTVSRAKKSAPVAPKRTFAVLGKHNYVGEDGKVTKTVDSKYAQLSRLAGSNKQAGMFSGGLSNYGNIADSENIGYYDFEFPVDMLELPQSRKEEIRFYRLASDREPLVGRGIDLHTDIPLSKLILDKPTASSQKLADYVYDFYSGLANKTELFTKLIEMSREYWLIGEAFAYVEQEADTPLCGAAKDVLEGDEESDPQGESENAPTGADELDILGWVHPKKKSSIKKAKALGITMDMKRGDLDKEIRTAKLKLARIVKVASLRKTAAPGDEEAENPEVTKDDVDSAVGEELDITMDDESFNEASDTKELIHRLEEKKELLEELRQVKEEHQRDVESFQNLTNKKFKGWDKIRMIPPERVEIVRDGKGFEGGPSYMYEPSADQKARYLSDPELDQEARDMLENTGKLRLNQDPLKGSFLIHFARKKASFEDHGRSILQRCLRTIIYRDKLRQVQTTIASRNMTPKTLVVAPEVPDTTLDEIRGMVDEAKADPDFTIAANFEMRIEEIGSEGRILNLESEWAQTSAVLAIGLGFSPDILVGEGMFSNSKVHLELMSSTYNLYRELISSMVEEYLFKPIAMKKGFYEIDDFGRPRWIYPKLSFNRLALRDSGEVYDMMYNMYNKGSLPVETILDFLNIDPVWARKKLEEAMFTVNDSKSNELLTNIYSQVVEPLLNEYDLTERVATGMSLKKKQTDKAGEDGLDGTGEGMV